MAKSSKNPKNFPDPIHRSNVILEEMQGQFLGFGEGLADVQEKVSIIPQMQEDIQELKSDVATIKTAFKTLNGRVSTIESKVSTIESKVSTIESTMATKKDIQGLGDRLTKLETH